MPTKHEWAREWFGTRRPPRPQDLEDGPTGPPPTYIVQLFYEPEPRLDPAALLTPFEGGFCDIGRLSGFVQRDGKRFRKASRRG